ncbi:MAG TPA: hypothetical protein EYQ54_11460 [Myxococcales bacterium]|nr:hypothetical protein [Myxococcales bacterium]
MTRFDYPAFEASVPRAVGDSHRAAWERIASPGYWWNGSERVEAARLAREARSKRDPAPWQRQAAPSASALLPAAAADLVRRVAADVHTLNADSVGGLVGELGDAAYVELCAVVVCVTAIDAFAEALGVEPEPLPEPRSGQPDGLRPGGMAEAGAFVPMTDNASGPNVGRAMSLAPLDNAAFLGLVGSMYSLRDFSKLVWEGQALSRPQVELVAARVSAVNECFY